MKMPVNEKGETIVFLKGGKIPLKAKFYADYGNEEQIFRIETYDRKKEGVAIWDTKKNQWTSYKLKKVSA